MGLFSLLRFITPNATVAVSELGADLTTTAALGQAVENLDTYATRNNGTNTATSAMTLDLSAIAVNTFKTRVAASAAPTADGSLETDSTSHAMVRGRNGSKVTLAELETAQTVTGAQTYSALVTASAGVDASAATAGATKVNDLQVLNGASGTGVTMTDIAAPAAPGAGKTVIYTVSGVPHYRAGASGSDTTLGGLTSANATATLGADQALTQNTMTDVISVTVPASQTGTYLVSFSVNVTDTGSAASFSARAFDSTSSTTLCSAGETSTGAGGNGLQLASSKIVSLTAGDTIKLQATSNQTASSAKAAIPTNGAGNTATNLSIVRIA